MQVPFCDRINNMVNCLLFVLTASLWITVNCQSCTKDSLSNAERNLETASDDYFLCNAEQVFTSWESKGNQAQATRILLARWNHAYSRTPSPSNPIGGYSKEKQWAKLYNSLYNFHRLLTDSNFKAPRVQEYPGDVDSSTRSATVTATVKVTPQADDESHATGLYLPAGNTATVTVLTSVRNNEWYIEVGCQSDNPESYYVADPLKRPHMIYRSVTIYGTSMKVYSAYGGPIFIRNAYKSQAPISIAISNVVEGPYLNLRDYNTVSQWNNRLARTGGVPWSVVEGDMISFCAPTRVLKKHGGNVEQLRYVLQDIWDKIVKLMFEFVGDSWKTLARRERVVYDVAPSVGYMHSGYPIVATEDEHLTEEAFNAQVIKSLGAWGTIHELGHNRQFSGYLYDRFTFTRVGEVTNNVLVAFIRETLWNFPIYSRVENDTLKQHIRNGAPWSDWKVWLAFPTYIQMAQHFGWGTISQWMRTYTAPGTKQPPTDQDQVDAWAERMCTVTGMNLIPLFDYWNIPVSKAVKDRQQWQQVNGQWQARPCFLPLDWITQLDGGARYRQIHGNYGNRCATTPLKYQRNTQSVDTSIYLRNTVEVSVQRSG